MKWFIKFAVLCIVGSYLLIFVGSLVRISGAGLGCPDWPKCHGEWLPPFSQEQLEERLIKERMKTTTADVAADSTIINPDRHHYILSWIEYLNRLAGVTLGIIVIITLILAIYFFREKHSETMWLAALLLLLTIVNGIVGKYVVSSELSSWLISIHLALALIMISLALYMTLNAHYFMNGIKPLNKSAQPSLLRHVLILWIISLIQISFGAALRGEFEIVLKSQPFLSDFELFEAVVWVKYCHIAIGILVAAYSLFVCWKLHSQKQYSANMRLTAILMLALIVIELIGGFLFRHFGLNGLMRIYHLWLGTLHICFLLYLFLTLRNSSESNQQSSSKLYLKALLASVLVFIIMGLIAWKTIRIAELAHQVPYLADKNSEVFNGRVPDFEFIERDGTSFGLKNMMGKFVILNFMFTQCKDICPMSTNLMFRKLYTKYKHESLIQFVSISVDPENDTLEELGAFARRNDIEDNNKKWVFLRGELNDVKSLSLDGFKLMDDFPENHSPRYVLIDKDGYIRSMHPYNDEKSIELLQNHIEQLVRNHKNEHQ